MKRRLMLLGTTVLLALLLASPGSAQAYPGYAGYSAYTPVDSAIDAAGLPPVFHSIAERESGDNPYAVNPYSGACGPFQFLPSTAYGMNYVPTSSRYMRGGYTCAELTDPYVAAQAALELYRYMGLSPWSLTAY